MHRLFRFAKYIFIVYLLFTAVGCEEQIGSYEKESNDLHKRAYNINFQLVTELSYLSDYTKTISSKADQYYIPPNRINVINERFGRVVFGSDYRRLYINERLDSLLKKNKKFTLLTTRVVIVNNDEVYFYPKSELSFPNLEKSDFDYMRLDDEIDSVKVTGNWITRSFIHPLESHRVIAGLHKWGNNKSQYAAAHFSVELLEENFIDNADGTFIVLDREGVVHAASGNAFQNIGLFKMSNTPSYITRKRTEDRYSAMNVFNSRNEHFRSEMHDILFKGKKTGRYTASGSEFALLSADIKELKWKIIRIIAVND